MACYMNRLYKEMDAQQTEWEAIGFDSLFIGGGTPSVLPAAYISEVIRRVRGCFNLSDDAEITVEANPESFTPQKAFDYAQAGVNRLSLGVQSTNEWELKLLGRPHTWMDAQNALDYARMAGIENISMDLMYNLPNQRTEDYLNSVRNVLDLGISHLSCYALSLEEGTPLYGAVARHELPTPDKDAAADMWEATEEIVKPYGLCRYEISNYAKADSRSNHNLHYWNQDSYLGLGAAAHSARMYDRYILRTANSGDLTDYIKQGPAMTCERISGKERMFEYIMLKTRLCEGFLLDDFQLRFGLSFADEYESALQRAVLADMAKITKDRFCLTGRGLLMQNSVLQWFMLDGE